MPRRFKPIEAPKKSSKRTRASKGAMTLRRTFGSKPKRRNSR